MEAVVKLLGLGLKEPEEIAPSKPRFALPCPFCGSDDLQWGEGELFVICRVCECTGPVVAAKWNHRPGLKEPVSDETVSTSAIGANNLSGGVGRLAGAKPDSQRRHAQTHCEAAGVSRELLGQDPCNPEAGGSVQPAQNSIVGATDKSGICQFCHLFHNPEKSNCNDPKTGELIRRRGPITKPELQKIVAGAPDKGRDVPFEPIEGPIDFGNPFAGRERPDLLGTYVTRDDRETEILVEIKENDPDTGAVLGNAFTLRGGYIELSPEEAERITREFYRGQEK